jgi:peroxiredoxin
MKNKNFLIAIVIIFIIDIAAILYIIDSRKHKQEFSYTSNLNYGDKTTDYYFKDNKGRIFNDKLLIGKIKLFLFFNPLENWHPLKQADILYKKYKNKYFIVFGIYPEKIDLKKISPDFEDISFPLIHDRHKSVYLKFKVHPEQNKTIFIDKDNIVRFTESWLIEDDLMNLLVEKFVFKSSTKEEKSIRIGQIMPDLSVWDVSNKEKAMLRKLRDTIAVIFVADCAPCKISKYFRTFRNFEEKHNENTEIIGVFSKIFLFDDLLKSKMKHKIKSSIYLLREDIDNLDILAASGNEKSPIWMYVNDQGIVEFIEKL